MKNNLSVNLINGCPAGRYTMIHGWLRDTFGKASKCENPNCQNKNPKRFEYALKNGCEYDFKRDNFIQLCRSCHVKYDYPDGIGCFKPGWKHSEESLLKIGKASKGRTFTPEAIKKMSDASKNYWNKRKAAV